MPLTFTNLIFMIMLSESGLLVLPLCWTSIFWTLFHFLKTKIMVREKLFFHNWTLTCECYISWIDRVGFSDIHIRKGRKFIRWVVHHWLHYFVLSLNVFYMWMNVIWTNGHWSILFAFWAMKVASTVWIVHYIKMQRSLSFFFILMNRICTQKLGRAS